MDEQWPHPSGNSSAHTQPSPSVPHDHHHSQPQQPSPESSDAHGGHDSEAAPHFTQQSSTSANPHLHDVFSTFQTSSHPDPASVTNDSSEQHSRLESFSRSRSSTGAMSDSGPITDMTGRPDVSQDPATQTQARIHQEQSPRRSLNEEYVAEQGDNTFSPNQLGLENGQPGPAGTPDEIDGWAKESNPIASDSSDWKNHSLDAQGLGKEESLAAHHSIAETEPTGSESDNEGLQDRTDHDRREVLHPMRSDREIDHHPEPSQMQSQNAFDEATHSSGQAFPSAEDNDDWAKELGMESLQDTQEGPTEKEMMPLNESEPAQLSLEFGKDTEGAWEKELFGKSPQQATLPAAEKEEPLFQSEQPVAHAGEETRTDSLEDSWAAAMADEPGIDDAWGSVFAEGLDDEGFLEDEKQVATPQATASASNTFAQSGTNAYLPASNVPNSFNSPYGVPTSVEKPRAPEQRSTSGGMKFFEELPVVQSSRARRPKQQNFTQPSQPGQPQNTIPPPPRQSQGQQLPQFAGYRQPERLDPFPPQPTVLPGAAPANFQTPHPPNAQINSRYSPAPTQPATPSSSKYAAAPGVGGPPAGQRYSPAQAKKSTHPAPSAKLPAASQTAQQTVSSGISTQSFVPQPSNQPAKPTAPPPTGPPRFSSRYSPAPSQSPASQTQPPEARVPPSSHQPSCSEQAQQSSVGPPPSIAGHRFAPRTASPLAQHETAESRPLLDRSQTVPMSPHVSEQATSQPLSISQNKNTEPLPPVPESPALTHASRSQSSVDLSRFAMGTSQQPPPTRTSFEPPRRPRTQSPESTKRRYQAVSESSRQAPMQPSYQAPRPFAAREQSRIVGHGPSISDKMDFVEPSDPLEASDPLKRWKGSPLIRWSTTGSVVCHFPTRTPRYGGGQAAPALKSSPGPIKIRKLGEAVPFDEILTSFPGPLKSKGKKKELLGWLSRQIETLQRERMTIEIASMDPRLSERIMLWQLMQIMVEHDGLLTGNPTVDMAVRQVLSPPTGGHQRAVSDGNSNPPSAKPDDVVDSHTMAEMKQNLLDGDREKAIWKAADHRLWGHALIMASTLNPSIWKSVAQEFVRKEVRDSRQNNQSLAALYSVFAGNWDESIDELVPVSARAGFQMVSTAESVDQTTDSTEGLSKWQETLTMVLNNRSNEDERSLLSLGRLLRGYGRIEAAHTCFIFARSFARFSGHDDPEADLSLLAADMRGLSQGAHDMEAILLSEVYEFALSLSPSNTAQYAPHLQAYKLHHAYALAESGCRNEALAYCDAIAAAIKSSTKLPPYYHPILASQLDELSKTLSQSPKESTSSWMSKPAIGKVSGSMWAKFNNFVAGDDDAASEGSFAHSEGENAFSKITGTPTISRETSHMDLHGTGYSAVPATASTGSRYAPSYSSQNTHLVPEAQSTLDPMQAMYASTSTAQASYMPSQPSQATPEPLGPYARGPPYPNGAQVGGQGLGLYGAPQNAFTSEPGSSGSNVNGYAPATNGYMGGNQNYEPQQAGGYEPSSSYQPYEPSIPDSSEQTGEHPRPKKSLMDDDDDDEFAHRSDALKRQERAAKDRQADDAVRKAAEEDGK